MEETLDEIPQLDKAIAQLKKRRNYLFFGFGLLTLLSYVLFEFAIQGRVPFVPNGYHPLIYFAIGAGVWGLILGLLMALIPFRKVPYGKKYWTAAALGMCLFQLLFVVSMTMAWSRL